MRDRTRKILISLLFISIFTLPLLSNPTGNTVQEIQRPLISCNEKIDSRFPNKIILTAEDPIMKQGCDNGNGLVIQKNLITIDCNGYTIKSSTGRFSGVAIESRFGITIKNCNIVGFGSAVKITNSNKNIIVDNRLSGLDQSILITKNSKDNTIKNNYFSGNLGIKSSSKKGGNLIFGNYLSPNTVDDANLQKKSSCGVSGKTLLAYG